MGALTFCRFDVFLIGLDPTIGSEMKKTRPGVIVSPDQMNRHLHTVIIAPLTTVLRKYPTRIPIIFEQKNGEIALDQIRTVDKNRLVKKLGCIREKESRKVCKALGEMFVYE